MSISLYIPMYLYFFAVINLLWTDELVRFPVEWLGSMIGNFRLISNRYWTPAVRVLGLLPIITCGSMLCQMLLEFTTVHTSFTRLISVSLPLLRSFKLCLDEQMLLCGENYSATTSAWWMMNTSPTSTNPKILLMYAVQDFFKVHPLQAVKKNSNTVTYSSIR